MPKNHLFTALMTAACLLPAGSALAQFNEHYIAGTEGIRPGSLPGPGIYFDDINLYANLYQNAGGVDAYSVRSSTYVNEPRLRWISEPKLLGAGYGIEVMLPMAYGDDRYVLSDVEVSPLLLSWHLQHFDFSAGYAVWIPTGDFKSNPPQQDPALSPNTSRYAGAFGQHWWGHMITAGGTWYPDTDKKWAVSSLNHYEINQSHEALPAGMIPHAGFFDVDYGQLFTTEWSVSRTAGKYFELGLVGNYTLQTTPTHVTFPGYEAYDVTSVHSGIELGPEIKATVPQWDFSASLRYLHQMTNPNGDNGSYNLNIIALTLSKRF